MKKISIYISCYIFLIIGILSCEKNTDNADFPTNNNNSLPTPTPNNNTTPNVTIIETPSINPSYINLDWDVCNLQKCDTVSDTYIFTAPLGYSFQKGNVIQVNTDSLDVIIVVRDAQCQGNTHTIHGEKGTLADIFSKGSFMINLNENTSYTKTSIEGRLFDYDKSYENLKLLEDKEYNCSVTIPEFRNSAKLDASISFNFGDAEESFLWEGMQRWRSGNMIIKSNYAGTLSSKMSLNIDWSHESKDHFRSKILNMYRNKRVPAIILGIPVIVRCDADWFAEVNTDISGNWNATTGYEFDSHIDINLEWDQTKQKGERGTVTFGYNHNLNIEPLVMRITDANAYIKARFFPKFKFVIYGTIGEIVELKPYLSASANGSGYASINLTNINDAVFDGEYNTCWKAGIDFYGALEFYDFADKRHIIIETPKDTTLVEWELFNQTLSTLSSCPDSNHPHLISLGLPSHKQWSCTNINASSPQAYGLSVRGTTVNYPKKNGCNKQDVEELLAHTSHTWTELDGVSGMKFTSTNGSSIFLPAGGYVYAPGVSLIGTSYPHYDKGVAGYYSLDGTNDYLYFDKNTCEIRSEYPLGYSVFFCARSCK